MIYEPADCRPWLFGINRLTWWCCSHNESRSTPNWVNVICSIPTGRNQRDNSTAGSVCRRRLAVDIAHADAHSFDLTAAAYVMNIHDTIIGCFYMELVPTLSLRAAKLVLRRVWNASTYALSDFFASKRTERLTFSQGSHILVDLRWDGVFARRKSSIQLEVRNLRAPHPFMHVLYTASNGWMHSLLFLIRLRLHRFAALLQAG